MSGPALLPFPRQMGEVHGRRTLHGGRIRVAGADTTAGAVRQAEVSSFERADVVVELGDRPIDTTPVRGLSPTGVDDDESYRIGHRDGRLSLAARHEVGVFRGLTTICQMVDPAERYVQLFDAADAPSWRWRGLSLDTARAEFSLADLRRVVDLLAAYKFNVLHLHLSDTQAWRLVMPSSPKLTPHGAVAYSVAELTALASYAAQRHVTVIPELDMPGHTYFAISAYPELGGDTASANRDHAHLRPSVDAAMRFARSVIDVLCAVAPGPYVHIGGDEPIGMDPREYDEFLRTTAQWVRDLGKRPVVWQEGVRTGALGDDDVVQLWISPGDTVAVEHDERSAERAPTPGDALTEPADASRGDTDLALAGRAHVLVSSSDPFYLDRRYGEASVDPAQNASSARLGMETYPAKRTSELYATTPAILETFERADRLDRVAGMEAAVWAETITGWDDLSMLLLPRLAVHAETMWGTAATPWTRLAATLRSHGPRWGALGFDNHYRSEEIFG